MTQLELEKRLAALETKVETLTTRARNKEWVLRMWGSFADDSDFEKAMRYGRKWREAENRRSLGSGRSTRGKKRPR